MKTKRRSSLVISHQLQRPILEGKDGESPNIRPVYLSMRKPFVFDAEGADWNMLQISKIRETHPDVADELMRRVTTYSRC